MDNYLPDYTFQYNLSFKYVYCIFRVFAEIKQYINSNKNKTLH
jgi:hypothetical protein